MVGGGGGFCPKMGASVPKMGVLEHGNGGFSEDMRLYPKRGAVSPQNRLLSPQYGVPSPIGSHCTKSESSLTQNMGSFCPKMGASVPKMGVLHTLGSIALNHSCLSPKIWAPKPPKWGLLSPNGGFSEDMRLYPKRGAVSPQNRLLSPQNGVPSHIGSHCIKSESFLPQIWAPFAPKWGLFSPKWGPCTSNHSFLPQMGSCPPTWGLSPPN